MIFRSPNKKEIATKTFDLSEFRSRPLPSEEEIISMWKDLSDRPAVSVLCFTYNQEEYIIDALRGFLTQQTDYSFEVIVHDDASTDSTPDIIKKYANKYPQIIKPVIQTQNQYSEGKRLPLLVFPYAQGEYIALCEGDDFWISPIKLQTQVEMMRNSSEQLCFHSAYCYDQANNKIYLIGDFGNGVKIGAKEIIWKGGGAVPTCSMLITRDVFESIGSWFKFAPVGDYYLQILGAQKMGALYIDKSFSVYRTNVCGSWSDRQKKNLKEVHLQHIARIKKILYHKEFENQFKRELIDDVKSQQYQVIAYKYLQIGEIVSAKKYMSKSWKIRHRFELVPLGLLLMPASFIKAWLSFKRNLRSFYYSVGK